MRMHTARSFHAALAAVLLLLTVLVATPAWAAPTTYTVTKTTDTADGTCNADCSLREAITAANANAGQDTIVIPAGTYGLSIVSTDEDANLDGDLDITDSLIIRGAGIGATIIDANGAVTGDRALDLFGFIDVSLSDLRVTDGDESQEGGGIRAGNTNLDGVTLSLNRVRVNANNSDDDGGGIHAGSSSVLTIIDSRIDNNTSGSDGGGIYVDDGHLTLIDSDVDDNESGSDGGAMHLDYAVTEITGGSISDNDASSYGGAISADYALATIMGTTVEGNTADYGGAVYVSYSTIDISETSLDLNTAETYGGTIYVDYGVIVVTDSPITNSGLNGGVSSLYGGAVYNDYGNAELVRSPISDTVNTTTSGNLEGGAIYTYEGQLHREDSPISNTTSSGFTSTVYGGAIYCDASLCTEEGDNSITGTSVNAGASKIEGGAVYVYEAGLRMVGDSVSDTQAITTGTVEGAGFYIEYGGLDFDDMDISRNVADTDGTAEGGGVFLNGNGEGLRVTNSRFTGNVAATGGNSGNGGAIYCNDDYGSCTIEGSLFEGNTATNTGGAVYWYYAGLIIRDSQFIDNSVVNPDDATDLTYGGALGSDDYGGLLIERSLFEGNTATYEGGAIYTYDSPMIMRDSVVRNNAVVEGENGSSGYGGAIYLDANPALIERSVIEGNSVTADGNAQGGGIYADASSLKLRDTTVSGNSVVSRANAGDDDAQGGGVYLDGTDSTLVSERSLFTANSASFLDAAGQAEGGAVYSYQASNHFLNSTLSENDAEDGAAVFNFEGGTRLTNATVFGNTADTGSGAIDNDNGYVAVKASAFGGNSDSCAGDDVESRGFNLADDDTCLLDLGTDDDDTDPLLGALAFNGGHTDTHAPLDGSPLIDHGGADCTDITDGFPIVMDQRGAGRPGGSACDTGAYEFGVGVTVTATDADAAEDGPDTGEFTFARPDTDGELTVTYVVSGTATADDDYAALTGTATFADGAATTTAIVTPVVDATDESDETVVVTLEPGVDYTIATPSEAAVTITDAEDVVTPPGGPPAGLHRLAGENRFATAAAVVLDRYDPDDVDVVYIATGRGFPDALAGGPLAIADGAPILLSEQATLPAETAAALATLAPSSVVALGGPVALSDATLAAAGAAAGGAATSRIAGPDRYATAAAVAAKMPASDTVYLAVGTNFPDALAGGPVTNGAPILLTQTDALPAATAAALASRAPTKVVALGGPVAISDATLAAAGVAAGGATTSRLSGPDRYATATTIAGLLTNPTTVYIAVGTNFPDALAGGPPAEAEGAPILLINGTVLPAATRTYLESLPNLTRIVILGGPNAVPTALEASLQALLAP